MRSQAVSAHRPPVRSVLNSSAMACIGEKSAARDGIAYRIYGSSTETRCPAATSWRMSRANTDAYPITMFTRGFHLFHSRRVLADCFWCCTVAPTMDLRRATPTRRWQLAIAVVAALSLFINLLTSSALRHQFSAAALLEPAAWTHAAPDAGTTTEHSQAL